MVEWADLFRILLCVTWKRNQLNSASTYSFLPKEETACELSLPQHQRPLPGSWERWNDRQLLSVSPYPQCLAQTAIFINKFACTLASTKELNKGFSSAPKNRLMPWVHSPLCGRMLGWESSSHLFLLLALGFVRCSLPLTWYHIIMSNSSSVLGCNRGLASRECHLYKNGIRSKKGHYKLVERMILRPCVKHLKDWWKQELVPWKDFSGERERRWWKGGGKGR